VEDIVRRAVEPRIDRRVPFFAARRRPGRMHPLAHAALPLEVGFLRRDHLVEQVFRLLNDHNHQVAQRLGRTRIEQRLPVVPVRVLPGELPRRRLLFARGSPFRRVMRFQIVEIVFQEFIQRRARHVGELDFRFLAGAAGRAALGDVLLAAARGLRHLIDRSVAARRQEAAAEGDGPLIDRKSVV